MHKWKQTVLKSWRPLAVVGLALPVLLTNYALAAPTYTSTNYGVDEVFMGAGGLNDASSATYKARASLGDTVVGNTASTSYQAYGGFTTTADPYIELVVNATNVDLGYLTTAAASTTSAAFTLKAYLASGYVVVNGSDPPSHSSGGDTHVLSALAAQDISRPGTEQFGINLVGNTSPTTFGDDPEQIPDASYSYGQVSANYATTNNYRYAKGETIAYSTKSSGITQYTVSYLYNISTATPAGEYRFNHVIVATATY